MVTDLKTRWSEGQGFEASRGRLNQEENDLQCCSEILNFVYNEQCPVLVKLLFRLQNKVTNSPSNKVCAFWWTEVAMRNLYKKTWTSNEATEPAALPYRIHQLTFEDWHSGQCLDSILLRNSWCGWHGFGCWCYLEGSVQWHLCTQMEVVAKYQWLSQVEHFRACCIKNLYYTLTLNLHLNKNQTKYASIAEIRWSYNQKLLQTWLAKKLKAWQISWRGQKKFLTKFDAMRNPNCRKTFSIRLSEENWKNKTMRVVRSKLLLM